MKPWKLGTRKVLIRRNAVLRALAEQVPFDQRTPWRELPEATRRQLLDGDAKRVCLLPPPKGRKPVETTWVGMFPELEQAYRTTTGESLRQRLLQYQSGSVCATCQGRRLSPTALSLRLDGLDLAEFLRLTIPEALAFARRLAAHPRVKIGRAHV